MAMAAVARWQGQSLRLGARGMLAALFLGFTQFFINYDAVYLAEQHITSGVVATVFALLLIPSSLLAWALLGQRPSARFAWGSLVAVTGIVLLFANELEAKSASRAEVAAGIGLSLVGVIGAAAANVMQAHPKVRRFPLLGLLAWAMAFGTLMDAATAWALTGPPVFDSSLSYVAGLLWLALAASVLTFALYYPVVRKIGPARAAYSSVAVPIIAMGFSTWLEDYRWTWLAIAGALLALGGMAVAMSRSRSTVTAPDAG
jgi:drug/metabolite transporter (DMT)-like permease